MRSEFYKWGIAAALEKTALAPALKRFTQRATASRVKSPFRGGFKDPEARAREDRLFAITLLGTGSTIPGALIGGVTGAVTSDEDHRLRGALQGTALGGLLGGVGGGLGAFGTLKAAPTLRRLGLGPNMVWGGAGTGLLAGGIGGGLLGRHKEANATERLKIALAPFLREAIPRAAISAVLDAGMTATTAHPEDRLRAAAEGAALSIPLTALGHTPDLIRYLKETRPGVAALLKRVRL